MLHHNISQLIVDMHWITTRLFYEAAYLGIRSGAMAW